MEEFEGLGGLELLEAMMQKDYDAKFPLDGRQTSALTAYKRIALIVLTEHMGYTQDVASEMAGSRTPAVTSDKKRVAKHKYYREWCEIAGEEPWQP